jgi:hypothetical protein
MADIPTNPASAIVSGVSGIFSAVGSVWTSINSLKSQKAQLTLDKAAAEAQSDADTKKILLKTLELKQAALDKEEAAQKSKANLYGIAMVFGAALIGFFGWLAFKKPKPNPISLGKRR